MTELKMEHILMVLIAGFVLYHFMGDVVAYAEEMDLELERMSGLILANLSEKTFSNPWHMVWKMSGKKNHNI